MILLRSQGILVVEVEVDIERVPEPVDVLVARPPLNLLGPRRQIGHWRAKILGVAVALAFVLVDVNLDEREVAAGPANALVENVD